MCLGGGSAPAAPAAPQKPAEIKQPETVDAIRADRKSRKAAGEMAGGTLLTGPAGLQPGALDIAKPSLLGA